MEFKDKVTKVRTTLLISQEELARNLCVSFATVNRWEKGRTEPNLIKKTKFDNFCKDKGISFEEECN